MTPDDARALLPSITSRAKRAPHWVTRALVDLGPLRWGDGEELDELERRRLVTLLMQEGPDLFDPTHWSIIGALDEGARARVGAALEEAWLEDGAKPAHKWAIFQLAPMRAHATLIARAPELVQMATEGKYKRALWYLEALARIDHQSARSWIHELSLHAPYESALQRAALGWHDALLPRAADERAAYLDALDLYIREDTEEAHITPVEHFDPGITTLSLHDEDYILTLAPQSFELMLQHTRTRERLTEFPDESLHDDPARWRTAHARFSRIKAELQPFLLAWRDTFERAMISGRPFTLSKIRERFLSHRLMNHLIETLLWRTITTDAADDALIVRFTEGDCVDAEEDIVELADDTALYLVHPLDMTASQRLAWNVHFAENEIFPLFLQLTRPVYGVQTHPLSQLTRSHIHQPKFVEIMQAQGWRHGEVEGRGSFRRSYQILPGRDARIWLHHGKVFFQSEGSWAKGSQGGRVDRIELMTLRGRALRDDQLSIVHSEAYLLVLRLLDALTPP